MFITFEGPDGCGKTTQIALLDAYLNQQGYSVFRTREPGGTEISERIRAIVHDRAHADMDNRTEVLLYSASRAQLVAEKIRPALAQGDIVLCDRFFDSTYAYQGYGRGLDLPTLRLITGFATGGLKPDLTICIDIDPKEGLRRRMKDREAEWNRLDNQELAFHQRVYAVTSG
jgi:dTMP kinase